MGVAAVAMVAVKPDTDIERLLQWAISNELADRYVESLDGPDLYRGGVSADGCFAVERYGRLGTFIDCSGSGGPAMARCHEDAELVYRVARDILDAGALTFVVACARKQDRPLWNPFPVVQLRPIWVLKGNGKKKPRTYSMPSGARFCPVETVDRGPELAHYRELYLWWWQSLRAIEAALRGENLTRWNLTRWTCPEEPWRKIA